MIDLFLKTLAKREKERRYSLTKFAMDESIEKLDQLTDFFLKYPELFKESFITLPEYKRKALIELLNGTEEAG